MNQKQTTNRPKKNRRKTARISGGILIVILLLIGIAVGAIYYLCNVYKPDPKPLITGKAPSVTTDENGNTGTSDNGNGGDYNPPTVPQKEGFYNYLVLGKDVGGGNTDVFMLISFDTKNHSIALMQIPRDTYMEADGSHYKINSLYAHMRNRERRQNSGLSESELTDAAMRDVCVALGNSLNMTIHYYAIMDLQGFRNIVDVLGGVYVDVPRDMTYVDKEQNLHIYLKKGPQRLDGEKAEQFVRFRKGYRLADITRIDAQKIFMTALINQVKTSLTVNTVGGMVQQVIKYVNTSMPVSDMVHFAQEFFSVDNANIYMLTCPGEATYVEGISYYVIHREQMLYYVNRYFNVYEADINEADFDSGRVFVSEQYSDVLSIYEKAFEQPDNERTAEDITNNGLPLI